MARAGWWMGALGITLVLGCEEGAGGNERPPEADGGELTQEDASDSSADASTAPPLVGCAVLRKAALPNSAPVVRVPGGFVTDIGSELQDDGLEHVRWRAVSEDGARQAERSGAASASRRLALLPTGQDPFSGVIVYLASDGREHVSSAIVSTGGTNPSNDLGPAYYRGTLMHAATTSFDGTRAVHVSGHVAVDNPHALVLNERGERVGANLALMQADSPLFGCLQVTPTETAAAVSFVDKTTTPAELKVFSLSAQAELQASASLPLEGEGCPGLLQSVKDGIVVDLAGPSGTFDLRILRGAELQQVAAQAPPLEGTPRVLWVDERAPTDLLLLFRVDGDAARLARLKDGQWSLLDTELPAIRQVVPSESGRLFVTDVPALDSGATQLYEIVCGDLDS